MSCVIVRPPAVTVTSRPDRDRGAARDLADHGQPRAGRALVAQQLRRRIERGDQDVEPAVVVEVAHGEAAVRAHELESRPRLGGGVAEQRLRLRGRAARRHGAAVLQQEVPLAVRADDLGVPVDLGIDVPVGDDEVEIAVVVEVGEGRAPLQRRGRSAGPTPVVSARVLEEGAAEALVERREVLGEVGRRRGPGSRRRPRRRGRPPCWPGRRRWRRRRRRT